MPGTVEGLYDESGRARRGGCTVQEGHSTGVLLVHAATTVSKRLQPRNKDGNEACHAQFAPTPLLASQWATRPLCPPPPAAHLHESAVEHRVVPAHHQRGAGHVAAAVVGHTAQPDERHERPIRGPGGVRRWEGRQRGARGERVLVGARGAGRQAVGVLSGVSQQWWDTLPRPMNDISELGRGGLRRSKGH